MKRLALLLLIVGCTPQISELPPDGIPPKSTKFVTIQHDQHWWIYTLGEARHFVHHPDCPCVKHRRPILQGESSTPVN